MAQLQKTKFNTSSSNKFYTFADFPSAKIYAKPTGKTWKNHLLFGDYITIKDLTIKNNRVYARSRNTTGWINVDEIQNKRILEVNFIDIGQGDGCHIVTPDDQHILIDAGKTDNMNRYLSWRFNLYSKTKPLPFPFKVVISHSDLDHYGGFKKIFDNDKIKVSEIYHNGLVERPGTRPLGTVKNGFITGLVEDTADMLKIITKESNRKGTRSTYCKTLFAALTHNPNVTFKSLSYLDKHVDGFDESNSVDNKNLAIKVLGPIITKTGSKNSLKSINDLGKDKNGHSVILKLVYDHVRIMLGGDVNTEFGEIIYKHYKDNNNLEELLVDAAKACHHGSNHFHYGFVEAINSAATVISSGDDEAYAHPRPDTIGALGKCGYGERPLIFSTELARSNKEFTFKNLETIGKYFDKIKVAQAEIKLLKAGGLSDDSREVKKLKSQITKTNKSINSFVTKYGMINLRTDGKKMILAQKYEQDAASGKWDIHELVYSNSSKRFELQ